MNKTDHLNTNEPFKGMFTQGMVTHETYKSEHDDWLSPEEVRFETVNGQRQAFEIDGNRPAKIGAVEKVSKSKRNGVDPDEILKTYGADTARWFMLSDSPPERDVEWTASGIEGANRFVQRVWRLVNEAKSLIDAGADAVGKEDKAMLAVLKSIHRNTDQIGKELEGLKFNRAVALIYELTNALAKYMAEVEKAPSTTGLSTLKTGVSNLIQLIAPMMPHLAETCWAELGYATMVCNTPWPQTDETYMSDDSVTMPVQINGKKRGEIIVPVDSSKDNVEKEALSLDAVSRMLDGKTPKKVIVVPNRIVNVVA